MDRMPVSSDLIRKPPYFHPTGINVSAGKGRGKKSTLQEAALKALKNKAKKEK